MIGPLLEAAGPRAEFADAVAQTDETLSVTVGRDGGAVSRRESLLVQLRVQVGGRLGWAGGDRLEARALIEPALASAAAGSAALPLFPPGPSPLPAVTTWHPGAAALGAPDLARMARQLVDRLEREGREVEGWAERSAGRVDVGNTRGLTDGYDASLVGYGADLRVATAVGPLCLSLHQAAVAPPADTELAALVDEIEARLGPPLLDRDPPRGPVTVRFGPRAVAVLLMPVLEAARAERQWDGDGPFAGRIGQRVTAGSLTLVDEPTAPGRPGSRPVDDEGVVCHPLTVLEQGVLRGGVADLVTASRLGVPATGHAYRSGSAPARAGWSNLALAPGTADARALADAAGQGLLVLDFPAPVGRTGHGRVQLSTPWAYAVDGGEVRGRFERVTLSGDVFEWLNRVVAVGDAARWIGPRRLPELVVEGVDAR